jgi:hypothetical protein
LLLKQSHLNFLGNVEGKHFFSGHGRCGGLRRLYWQRGAEDV